MTFAADLPDIERGAEIIRTTLERLAREAPMTAERRQL